MKCVFCEMYEKRHRIIFENDSFFSRFDWFPVSPGHAHVIPKRHVASVFDLNEKEWSDLKDALLKVKETIEKTDLKKVYQDFKDSSFIETPDEICDEMLENSNSSKKPDAYNIGINDGRAAGRTIDHLHIHIIPRYFGDVEDVIGGVRHIIPGKGNYRKK